jgi:hypothetical protein
MNTSPLPAASALPAWAAELVLRYESDAANQFILHGNVNDLVLLPLREKTALGTLTDFLLQVLLPRFDVVLSYDLGNGIRVEKGGELFSQWPRLRDSAELPKTPRAAVECLTQYFRYCANLAALGKETIQVGCVLRAADLVAPHLAGGMSYDISALALLLRDWSADSLLRRHTLATFLIAENLNDLHPLLTASTRIARVQVPLPSTDELADTLALVAPRYPHALENYADDLPRVAQHLTGATMCAVDSLLKTADYRRAPLTPDDLVQLKRQHIEGECNGLIDFIESTRTLDDMQGQEKVKAWLRGDIALWAKNDLQAMPKGYLVCGPVGTGKTYLIECLAGEAGVPVVKIKNFRSMWVGTTEGNLEKIFRLLHALGRCIVFIDEADQALGKRDSGSGDSGLSGRIYAMVAEEMSRSENRGKLLWVLASSRPDLIEVDLKRPGRVDVKIPLFPTLTVEESVALLTGLCRRRQIELTPADFAPLTAQIPLLLTPGAAEALAVKLYRALRTSAHTPAAALAACLADYQPPVPQEVMAFQIDLAIKEASDLDFVPAALRPKSG